MKSFFERRDRWGHGLPLWLITGITFLIPVMGWWLQYIRLDNDVTGWLPSNDPQAKILHWYQDLFPSQDRVLVSWDDCSVTDPRLRGIAQRLIGVERNGVREGGSPLIDDVTIPEDVLKRMMSEGISFDQALGRIQGLLVGQGPLCIKLTEAARERTNTLRIGREIQDLARTQFGLEVELVERTLPQPTDKHLTLEDEAGFEVYEAARVYVDQQAPADVQLYWPRMHIDHEVTARFLEALATLKVPDNPDALCIDGTYFVRGSMAAMTISFSETGEADQKAAIAMIRAAAEEEGISGSQLHLGGRPVAATSLNQAVKQAGWNETTPAWNLMYRSPILLSFMITLFLTYFMLRSLRLAILVQSVSMLCSIAAAALIPATGASLNMVLVVMPTLLMVITTSGAIHICNYWKNSAIEDPTGSVVHAARMAWWPCLLASGTTAIGLASLVVSSLIPVRDFGIYSSIGCVISFLCVLYVLPSLMLYWPKQPPRPEHINNHLWYRLGAWLSRHRGMAITGNFVLTAFCLWGMFYFRTETKVIRYFPEESQVMQDYRFLEENLSGIVSVDTIVRFNSEMQQKVPFLDRARRILAIQDALKQHAEVSGTLSLASFIDLEPPGEKKEHIRARRNAQFRENLIGKKIHERLLKGGEAAEGIASLLALPQHPTDWKKKGDEGLNAAGDEVWRITCQSSILSDCDYAVLTKELAEIAEKELATFPGGKPVHRVTGLVPIFLRTQNALLESLINSFGLALLLVCAVMAVMLRSIPAALYAMLPNVMPVAIVFGLLGWTEIRVDIGTMITASVALGLAVDGTLHLITWFRQLIRQGMSRQEAVAKSLEHCAPALWQTSAAIGIGMLALYPVELLLISRFGWIMAAMIFAALWGDVILLPALLGGPLGAVIEAVERQRNEKNNFPGGGYGNASAESGVNEVSDVSPQESPSRGFRAACLIPLTPHFPRIRAAFPEKSS
ncbi:MAG: MMPL family transporter [Planctomycetaceae bacterium]|nr:MMPL family transporter [Planctomycetaceae bacterium]